MLCALGGPAGAAEPAPASGAFGNHTGFARAVEAMPGGREFLESIYSARRGSCECDAVTILADVDQDGADDLVRSATTSTRPYTTTFSLLSGRTGKLIGPASSVRGFGHPVPAKLGDGSEGFMYLSLDLDGGSFVITAGGVGATGVRLWERSWREGYPVPRASISTGFHGATLFEEDGRTDLVVATSTSVAHAGETTHLLFERLSGTTGETVDSAGSLVSQRPSSVGLDALANVTARGELDLLVQIHDGGNERITLELRPDVGAEPIWTTVRRDTHYGVFEAEAADVTGNRAAEILLARYPRQRLVALDGVTGRRVWSIDETTWPAVPSVSGRGADLLLADYSVTDGRVAVTVERRDPRRGHLWSTAVDVTARTRYRTLGGGDAWPVGDATGDAVADIAVQVRLWDDDGRDVVPLRASRQYLLDGRTGKKLGEGTGFFPLDGTFTAAGADAVEFRRNGGALTMSALDGVPGRVLWQRRLGKTRDWPPCDWDPRSLRTASGPDLLLIEIPRAHGDDELVFDGGTGELLWRDDVGDEAESSTPGAM